MMTRIEPHRVRSDRHRGRWPAAGRALPALAVGLVIFVLLARGGWAVTDEDIAAIGREAVTDSARPAPVEPPSFGGLMVRLMVSLGVVFGLMAGALWAARRWLPKSVQTTRGGQIQVLANRSVGSRRNLLLVRARDKTLLLGMTSQSIQLLTEFHDQSDQAWSEAANRAGLDEQPIPPIAVGTTSLE